MNLDKFNSEYLMYMSNLSSKRTGLPFMVWFSAKIPKHRPTIKVTLKDGDEVSIEIESKKVTGSGKLSSKDYEKACKWIDLNKDILLNYWNNAHMFTIDSADVCEAIVKID